MQTCPWYLSIMCGLLLALAMISTALAILPMTKIADTRFSSMLQETGLR